MQYDDMIARIRRLGRFDSTQHAETATQEVLNVLGERLAGGEPEDLASQLPKELKETVSIERGAADPFGAGEFIRRVGEREHCPGPEALRHAQAVLSTVLEAVTGGQAQDVLHQLPDDYQELLHEPT